MLIKKNPSENTDWVGGEGLEKAYVMYVMYTLSKVGIKYSFDQTVKWVNWG